MPSCCCVTTPKYVSLKMLGWQVELDARVERTISKYFILHLSLCHSSTSLCMSTHNFSWSPGVSASLEVSLCFFGRPFIDTALRLIWWGCSQRGFSKIRNSSIACKDGALQATMWALPPRSDLSRLPPVCRAHLLPDRSKKGNLCLQLKN